jgi:hypothetical protein
MVGGMEWLKRLHAGQVVLVEAVVLVAVPVAMYAAAMVVDDDGVGARVWMAIWAVALFALVAVPWVWLSSRRPER